jgi:hypothetical protein
MVMPEGEVVIRERTREEAVMWLAARIWNLREENKELRQRLTGVEAERDRLAYQLDSAMNGLRWYADDRDSGGRAREAIKEVECESGADTPAGPPRPSTETTP